ncbi:YrdB family protein [Kitasatospora sp. CM 4170]|uniref:YrdB family protein n=1 Tax=Kitasatospora aburaviensis TaxID=67265 RepID=A0ABW1F1B0_9ACTN|nr:YrdB family protein [Kitasatospora sp. CM 4170]WNM44994.1 YrdB family protein [Kitasatospora sp. CM 4170]
MRIARPGPVARRHWTPLTVVNGGVAFALELGLLAALCYWGFRTGSGPLTRVLLGIGAPAAAAATWGLFLAAGGPTVRLPLAAEIAVKLAVFAVGALALNAAGRSTLALVFGAVALVSVAVEYTAG